MNIILLILLSSCIGINVISVHSENIPIVITTWAFTNSTLKAWEVLKEGGTALDAVEQGASVCEVEQCDGTVGYGGSPDENSETTLDALLMDGTTMNVGAVGALRRVRRAVAVARLVLERTEHSLLVGELATQFALQMGFREETLTTPHSKRLWLQWRNEKHCQPNFWMNVEPDPRKYCGPYRAEAEGSASQPPEVRRVDRQHHDTIGMVAVDARGRVAAGTSTNGAIYKIPGRVGDSPLVGAGAYADDAVGGAAATGDGDVMLRFLPSFLAVEEMRRGASPAAAARTAVQRIAQHFPRFAGAVVALARAARPGAARHGAACHGLPEFPYVVSDATTDRYQLITIKC